MQTIAEMLLNPIAPKPPEKPSKQTAFNSEAVLKCMEKNADKPCSKCNSGTRHRAKSGRIFTTLCTACYMARQAKCRKKQKELIE